LLYEVFIGLRHLKPKRRKGFISFITLLAIGGVALGVGALVIVLGVMNGFERDLKEKILGVNAHLLVLDQGEERISGYQDLIDSIKSLKGVEASSPFIQIQAILASEGRAVGIFLKGIDPELDEAVTGIQVNIISGTGKPKVDEEILIGSELSSQLGVGVGSPIVLILPKMDSTHFKMGILPHLVSLKVGGIFKSGMYDYDSSLACLHLKTVQRLLGLGDVVDGLAVRTKDIYQALSIKGDINSLIGHRYLVKTWAEMNKNLFSALSLEKKVMFIILTMIILVAGLGITSTLMMTILQRRKEIGILLAMGATRGGILRTFLLEGALIGLIGTVTGLLFGLVVCWGLSRFNFIRLPQDIYYIDYLPVDIESSDLLLIVLSAITLAVLAALYPAIRAARLDPVEIIRYE